MENSPKIRSWIQSLKRTFGVRIIQASWPRHESMPLFGVRCTGKFDGKVVDGHGTDQDKYLALIKAVGEWIERVVAMRAGADHTNGFAFHFNQDDAYLHSCAEVIERHLVILGFFRRAICVFPSLLNNLELIEKFGKINKNGEIKFLDFGSINSINIVGCYLVSCHSTGEKYCSFGFGANRLPVRAQEKAFIECINQFVNIKYGSLSKWIRIVWTLRSKLI